MDKWGVQVLGEDSWPLLVGAVTLLVSRDGVESCQVLDAVCSIVSSVHRSSGAVNGGIGDLVGQVAAGGGRLAPLLNALGASAKKEDGDSHLPAFLHLRRYICICICISSCRAIDSTLFDPLNRCLGF